jgi:hypothetical protein
MGRAAQRHERELFRQHYIVGQIELPGSLVNGIMNAVPLNHLTLAHFEQQLALGLVDAQLCFLGDGDQIIAAIH